MVSVELAGAITIAVAINIVLVLLVKRYVPSKMLPRIVIGILLLFPFIYLGFYVMAMYNGLYLLAGIQWGCFGGALYSFNSIIFKDKNKNA